MNTNTKKLSYLLCAFLMILANSCSKDETTNTPIAGTVSDIDGNTYRTITIGAQTWMVDNLRTTRYQNGDYIDLRYKGDTTFSTSNGDIFKVSYNNDIVSATRNNNSITAGYKGETIYIVNSGDTIKLTRKKSININSFTYNNTTQADSITTFGRLYNFYAATDVRKIAPKGWHIPTSKEWNTLKEYISKNVGKSGSISKALSETSVWETSSVFGAIGNDLTLNNSSGFSALPAGSKTLANGGFTGIGTAADWWSCSVGLTSGTSWYMSMSYYFNTLIPSTYDQSVGLSIRCIKD